ncbi:IS3 family transposase [Limosilactobacillus mucosae]
MPYYTQKLDDHHFIQSISQKANCLDNAPIESFFHLLKTEELLNGRPLIRNIEEFKRLVNGYINNIRISLKIDGLSPVEYRNEQLAA